MSDTIKDGGPAFPCAADDKSGWHAEYGMTLRDWFAGKALAGIAGPGGGESFSLSPDDSASWAYQYADAMIATRSKPDA